MLQAHLNFLGIQEARSEAGSFCSHDILRLAGGSAKGHLGVELWVSLQQPYASIGKRAHHFTRKHFTVVHADPRLLLVHVEAPHFTCWIAVGHSPHTGTDEGDRHGWWVLFSDLLTKHADGAPVFLLIDANALSGPRDDQAVHEHDDASNANTEDFRQLLSLHELCLPATSVQHTGDHATWYHPDGHHSNRIDYVAIPQRLQGACEHSAVLADFDLGNSADHQVAAIQLNWDENTVVISHAASNKHYPLDRQKIAHNPHLGAALQHVPKPHWLLDIEQHVAFVNEGLHCALRHHCGRPQSAPKKAYISEEIWTLRAEKLQLRAQLKANQKRLSREVLHKLFYSWKRITQTAALDQEDMGAYSHTLWCINLKLYTKFSKIVPSDEPFVLPSNDISMIRCKRLRRRPQPLQFSRLSMPALGPRTRRNRGLLHYPWFGMNMVSPAALLKRLRIAGFNSFRSWKEESALHFF